MNKAISSIDHAIQDCQQDIAHVIHHRLGIVIHPHQMPILAETIAEACHKFNHSPQDYLQLLRHCSSEADELKHLVAGVTIGETYFFRDKRQMQFLQEILFPRLIESKRAQGNLSLRIWSAGCATGEEIYTLAMMLEEMLPDIRNWTLSFLGTDINVEVLQKCLIGNYGEWSMRSISAYFKQKYFTKENQRYQLSEKIRNLVNFTYLNLNDNTYPSIINGTNAQDLILCRNVLIYFDTDNSANVMKKLQDSLVNGGYLMLGSSDPIQIKGTNLIFNHTEGIFVRKDIETVSPKVSIKPLFTTKAPSSPVMSTPQAVTVNTSREELLRLLHECRWQELLDMCGNGPSVNLKPSFLLAVKAKALANLGKLTQALACCQESLSLDTNDKHTYLTLSMIMSELNRLDEAENALRKTIFLDHHFVLGHFQLGLLLLKIKRNEAGLKSLKNALITAEKQPATQTVSGYPGLNYGRLTEILRNEINIHKGENTRNSNHVNQR